MQNCGRQSDRSAQNRRGATFTVSPSTWIVMLFGRIGPKCRLVPMSDLTKTVPQGDYLGCGVMSGTQNFLFKLYLIPFWALFFGNARLPKCVQVCPNIKCLISWALLLRCENGFCHRTRHKNRLQMIHRIIQIMGVKKFLFSDGCWPSGCSGGWKGEGSRSFIHSLERIFSPVSMVQSVFWSARIDQLIPKNHMSTKVFFWNLGLKMAHKLVQSTPSVIKSHGKQSWLGLPRRGKKIDWYMLKQLFCCWSTYWVMSGSIMQ